MDTWNAPLSARLGKVQLRISFGPARNKNDPRGLHRTARVNLWPMVRRSAQRAAILRRWAKGGLLVVVAQWLISRRIRLGNYDLRFGSFVNSRRIRVAGVLMMNCLVLANETSALAAEKQIRRQAILGQTIRLSGHVNYAKCGDAIKTSVAIIQPPVRGAISIRDEVVKSTEPVFGKGDMCRGYKGLGKAVYYTRNSTGTDKTDYDSVSNNGVVHVHAVIE
jgi:hypothetical protein